MSLYKAVKKSCDLLDLSGSLNVSCRVGKNGLFPALAPVKKSATLPSGVIYAARAEGIGRFFLCTSSYIYISGNGKSFSSLSGVSGDSPFLVEEISGGAPCAYLIKGATAVMHTGTSFKTFSYGANLSCGAMHCGRLFGADATNGLKLLWSGEGGVSDWAAGIRGSGSLILDPERGDILNILEYGEKLVLVRKYGLTVMSAFGAPENYKAAITDTDCDQIYKNTACVVGGKLMFYSASGLRSFDGSVISAVTHGRADDLSSPLFAIEYGGGYYLCCTSASLGGKAIMCYEPKEGDSYLINVAADGLCGAESIYAYASTGYVGVYTLEKGGQFLFRTSFDFGSGRNKTVTEIYADCGSADVEISNGSIKRAFSGAAGTIRPRLRGRKFTVTVKGYGALKKLSATAEVSLGI